MKVAILAKDIPSRAISLHFRQFAVGERTFSVWRPSGLEEPSDSCVAVVGASGVNAHRDPYVTEAPWLAELLVVLAREEKREISIIVKHIL